MRKLIMMVCLISAVAFVACGRQTFHPSEMPDPGPYMIHFHELDADGDDAATWDEFKARFPDTTRDVFNAVDGNGDGIIDHDEWHAFKEAHG